MRTLAPFQISVYLQSELTFIIYNNCKINHTVSINKLAMKNISNLSANVLQIKSYKLSHRSINGHVSGFQCKMGLAGAIYQRSAATKMRKMWG